MSFMLPRVAARLFDTPLLIDAGKARAMLSAIGGRVTGESVIVVSDVEAVHHATLGRVGDRLGRQIDASGQRPYDVVQNVAIVPIEGVLVHKGAWVGSSSGETSYQGLQTQIVRAAADPNIKGVAFEVDSLGGEAAGAFETANMLFALSQQKPTLAVLTDFACSGGYLLAAACRQIVMPANGVIGSIGAVTVHTDLSRALDEAGVTVTIIQSGERKADGSPVVPLSDVARERAQSRLDQLRNDFATAVGRYRAGRLSREQALATEADVFTGREAVSLGLADAVGEANAAFAGFVRACNRP